MEYSTNHMYFLSIHTSLKVNVYMYTKKNTSDKWNIPCYHMASSVSGQDESNPAL